MKKDTYCRDCMEYLKDNKVDTMLRHKCKQRILFKHGGEISKKAQDNIIKILRKEQATKIDIDFIKNDTKEGK